MAEHSCLKEDKISGIESGITEIKDSLKMMTELMITLARTDEKLKVVVRQIEDLHSRLLHTEEDLNVMKKCGAVDAKTLTWIERVIWIILASAIAVLF